MKSTVKKILVVFILSCVATVGLLHAAPRQLSFVWDPNSPDDAVTHYNIYRVQPGSPNVYTQLNTQPILTTTVRVTVDTGWILIVRAANVDGESGDSNSVVVDGPPSPPTNFKLFPF